MTSDPEWSPCEPGTLSQLTEQTAASSAQWTRRGALAAVITAAVGGGVFLMRNETVAGISCARVAELGPDYVADILTSELVAKIDIHRGHCNRCDSLLRRMEERRAQQA